ncbi:MAG: hypothetical protein R3B82_14035 [Sandaracinaceae bacterium]
MTSCRRLVLAWVLVVVGCGGDDDPPRAEPPPAATDAPAPTPPPPPPPADWVIEGEGRLARGRLAAGRGHACLVDDRHRTYCWGANEHGQLGDGTDERRDGVVRVPGLDDAVGVTCGGDSTCVWRTDGRVRCWGASAPEERGLEPWDVDALTDVVQVALSDREAQACARSRDGTVRCWGGTMEGVALVDGLDGAIHLARGGHEACAARNNGEVRCWRTVYGAPSELEPPLDGIPDAAELAMIDRYGGGVVCVRTAADRLRCPGDTDELTRVVAITGHSDHLCALREDGQVWCWGANDWGQLGVPFEATIGAWRAQELEMSPPPPPRPVEVRGELPAVRAIAAGGDFTCAVSGHGVRCWGSREHVPSARPAEATEVQGLDGVVELSASEYATCARTEAGALYCWGPWWDADRGGAPVRRLESGVTRLLGTDCVERADGTVCSEGSVDVDDRWEVTWPPGDEVTNEGERLCHRAPEGPWDCMSGAPAELASRPLVARRSSEGSGGCAAEGARVDCWSGAVRYGFELDGPVTQLSYGGSACALAGGRLWCWRTYHRRGRRRLHGPAPVRSFAVQGGRRVCGVLSDGRVACWTLEAGDGDYPIGDPELVPGVSGARTVVAGPHHFCATLSSGRVVCWGALRYRGGEALTTPPVPVR